MKIALIGQKGIPAKSGGVDRHVESLAFFLSQKGLETISYNRKGYNDKKLKEWEGIRIISLPYINTKNLAAITHGFLATLDAIRRKVDIIHFHGIGPCLLAWIPKLLRPKTKIVATLHSFDYGNDKWGGFAKFMLKLGEKMMTRYSDKVIVLTSLMKDYLYQRHGRDSVVIPNGAKINKAESSEILNYFNLEKNKYIVSVSRIIRLKGIQYLINSFTKLKEEGKVDANFKLAIVGDGEYKEELEKIAKGRNDIIFCGNQKDNNLAVLYSNAYLFVQSSEMEGLSISMLEAMAYGLPILASNISANLDAGADSVLYFESKNEKDLEDKLLKLVNNEELAKEFGNKAKYRVEKDYNWSIISDNIIDVYNKI